MVQLNREDGDIPLILQSICTRLWVALALQVSHENEEVSGSDSVSILPITRKDGIIRHIQSGDVIVHLVEGSGLDSHDGLSQLRLCRCANVAVETGNDLSLRSEGHDGDSRAQGAAFVNLDGGDDVHGEKLLTVERCLIIGGEHKQDVCIAEDRAENRAAENGAVHTGGLRQQVIERIDEVEEL